MSKLDSIAAVQKLIHLEDKMFMMIIAGSKKKIISISQNMSRLSKE